MNQLLKDGVSRRTFLAGAGLSAGTAAVATLAAGCGGGSTVTATPGPTSAPTGITDVDILNFALNLEYLEAEFYQRAVYGSGLSSADIGTSPGAVTGGAQVSFSTPALAALAKEIANDELAHVRFLRKALGSAAVDRPAIDFTDAFAALGAAADAGTPGPLIPIPSPFNPFLGEAIFLVGAFTFEDVGVTAYHGAAPLLTNSGNLAAAAGILATEGYHAAILRTALVYLGDPYLSYANDISKVRAAASTTATAGSGAEVAVSGSTIVPADINSIAFDRTTDQVMRIVYLTPPPSPSVPVAKGGFFPNGLNGKITATTT
ncbi:MAG TPA: ferritin-like domain-containing protein [Acidisarcina sp.]